MELRRFDGRRVVVTGGASGIGRATALRLAAEGAQVVAADLNEALLAEVSGSSDAVPGQITALVADVSSEVGAARLVSASVEILAGLDVVVNAAGILSFSHTHEQSIDEWNRVVAVNLTGTFLVCRESLPHLMASRGNIVNLASTTAHAGQAWAVAYSATKGGVLAMTRALAVEYGKSGVRANTISPGAIDTPITGAFRLPEGADASLLERAMPMGAFGSPDGVAAAVAYVASDEASHMNGADLVIDGGTLA
jgi:meso-butanediol dehydrogenase/(S,S)-butanediol dehydrogenase/diacetyl reductase